MSKAKELAKEYAENVILCVDHRSDVYDAFIDGYHQAEEDLELSWEDLKMIDEISDQVYAECDVDAFDEKEYYQEVLKRFNKGMRNK